MPSHSVAENIVNEVAYLERMERAGVPEHLRDGLMRYLVHRIATGHFLAAVLSNDLSEAVVRGDESSLAGLPNIVRFLYNSVPQIAWGSPSKVQRWLESKPRQSAIPCGCDPAANWKCEAHR